MKERVLLIIPQHRMMGSDKLKFLFDIVSIKAWQAVTLAYSIVG